MRWLLLTVLLATPALAGGPRFRGGARLGPATVRLGTSWTAPRPAPQVVVVPAYVPLAWWYWFPVQQPVPPPVPHEIIIEREVVREVPAAAPSPQVIVIQAPAPPAPVAVAPAPVAEAPKPPPGPRVPGPDVFTWTDADGVVHFSTRVPAEARARAKKVGSGAQ